jgi:hypothetical protein
MNLKEAWKRFTDRERSPTYHFGKTLAAWLVEQAERKPTEKEETAMLSVANYVLPLAVKYKEYVIV